MAATVVLSVFQAYGYAMFLETQVPQAVDNPGWGFRITMILALTTGDEPATLVVFAVPRATG